MDDTLRIMTMNCARGARAPVPPAFFGRAAITRNIDAIATSIDALHPDVVALQEVDRRRFQEDQVDQVARIAAGAHLEHTAFGAHRSLPRRGLHHGTALLSRTPIRDACSRAFRTTSLDPKGWVQGTLAPAALGASAVDVVSVHLDPFTPWTRRAQIATLQRALSPRVRPLVVAGDMNAAWGKDGRGDVARLAQALDLHAWEPTEPLDTYPSGHPWRRIDWILLSPELQFTSYATVPGAISDHRGVVADVVLR